MDLTWWKFQPTLIHRFVKSWIIKKFLYRAKKETKGNKAKTAQSNRVKEIRFGPNTDEHDFEFKLQTCRKVS